MRSLGLRSGGGIPGLSPRGRAQLQEIPCHPHLARIASEIEDQLASRSRALRDQRLRTAQPNASGPFILDGFFTFSPSELDLIETLAAQAPVTVTLPDWSRLGGGAGSPARRWIRRAASFTPPYAIPRGPFSPRRLSRTGGRADRPPHPRSRRARTRVSGNGSPAPRARALRGSAGSCLRPLRHPGADFISPTLFPSHPAIQYLSGIVRALLPAGTTPTCFRCCRCPFRASALRRMAIARTSRCARILPSSGARPVCPHRAMEI